MSAKVRTRAGRLLGALLPLLAVSYPLALLGLILALRLVGDRWWVTSLLLYLPRLGFALPLPLLALWLALARRFRLLALQGVSLLLLLFPLAGLVVNFRGSASEHDVGFRVLSYNVSSGDGGMDHVVDEVLAHAPDIAFLQEAPPWRAEEIKALLAPKYSHVLVDDQFVVASKFPLVASPAPEPIPFQGKLRSPRFMRYLAQTPLGPVAFISLHTVSPRGAFQTIRGAGLRKEMSSGRLFTGANTQSLRDTTALEELQIAAAVAMVARESGPFMIVGDSNLPTLSPVRARHLAPLRDGFADAGLGFGYSYPTSFPWMRIDLLLASARLRFLRVEVGDGKASDHLCVFGDVRAAN